MNTLEHITTAFNAFLQQTFQLSAQQCASITFALNLDEAKKNFGDASSNAALVLAKELQRNPRELAQLIQTSFTHESVEKIEIAGPGFLNFFFIPAVFTRLAQELFTHKDGFFVLDPSLPKQHYSLEFVSANPTGPLHLGHGRGGIIGDVLGNILRFLGHRVTKEFYINDAGSQIQKLGISLKIRCQQLLGEDVAMPEDGYQGTYLVALAQACVKEFGQQVVQQPDTFFAHYGKDKLLKDIERTLAHYGITYDVWFSEKTLHEGAIAREINKLTSSGHTYEKEGALWFKSTEFGDDKDRVLRKSDGELTYVAADIAYLDDKITRGHTHIIMVLGQDHHSYVSRLKGLLQAMGHNPAMLDVILYQLVSIKESGDLVRMSKRSGKLVTLEDVIETVGTDVARFFYLNRKADAHLEFDIALALKKTEENPVYYLQYAYVRTAGIVQKAQEVKELACVTLDDLAQVGPEERMLLKKIAALKDLLSSIGSNHQTHLLTYYALELAHVFHNYYSHNRIIEPANIPQSRARLAVVGILRNTLDLTLRLMGISRPEKM